MEQTNPAINDIFNKYQNVSIFSLIKTIFNICALQTLLKTTETSFPLLIIFKNVEPRPVCSISCLATSDFL